MATNSTESKTFFGDFRHALDAKKRITIPSRWRVGDADEFYLIPHQKEPCIVAMPPQEFERVPETMAANGISPAELRIWTRGFYSRVQCCAADKQGRLLLPEAHCKQAGLSDEVVLVGTHARFEIWNAAAWEKWSADNQATYERVSDIAGL